jgi:nucleotide-binding universal stress UspA family protein
VRILVAIDSSRASQCVLEEAATRPWPANTLFTIVNVVDLDRFAHLPAIVDDARREATTLLRQATDKLSPAGCKVNSDVLLGFPRNEISEYAKKWQANLVMVGSHGQGAIARFPLGSVAQGVLRTAPCSVEIVRQTASEPPASSHAMKILLATDGSDFSTAAAQSIADRQWPAGSQIRVLSIAELPIFENPMGASSLSAIYPATLLEELMESARKHAEDAVESTRKILQAGNLQVLDSKPAPIGDARILLLDLAKEWKADLIVLGSHGRRGMDRMLMGSVSESVAIHAHCSVDVIRA